MANKNENLTDEEFRKINYLKEMKEGLCDNCQRIIDEKIILIALS